MADLVWAGNRVGGHRSVLGEASLLYSEGRRQLRVWAELCKMSPALTSGMDMRQQSTPETPTIDVTEAYPTETATRTMKICLQHPHLRIAPPDLVYSQGITRGTAVGEAHARPIARLQNTPTGVEEVVTALLIAPIAIIALI